MKYLIGSTYFFKDYNDFISKDIDELEFLDEPPFQQMRQISGQGKCLFQLKRHSNKQAYIDWALQSSLGMVLGKFLIPEVCKEMNITIHDLPKLQPLLERLDDKHYYEKIIYDSYLHNNAFFLTDKQRDAAYQSYKSTRKGELK